MIVHSSRVWVQISIFRHFFGNYAEAGFDERIHSGYNEKSFDTTGLQKWSTASARADIVPQNRFHIKIKNPADSFTRNRNHLGCQSV